MFQRLSRVVFSPAVVLAKHKKKILAVPLAAVVLATGLALAPTTVQDVPVLSTLAERASAHDLVRNTLPFPTRVCEWEWEHVQVVTHYVDEFGNGPYPGPGSPFGPPLYPVFAWKQELVRTCHWELGRDQIPIPHDHLTQTQCKWALVVGSVTIGYFSSSGLARFAAAALGLTLGHFSIEKFCEENEVIVFLNIPPV